MTSAKPLAASVAALGIAVLAGPPPAVAAAAPRACPGVQRYAALSGAEMLRVLRVRGGDKPGDGRNRAADQGRPGSGPGAKSGAPDADRAPGRAGDGPAPAGGRAPAHGSPKVPGGTSPKGGAPAGGGSESPGADDSGGDSGLLGKLIGPGEGNSGGGGASATESGTGGMGGMVLGNFSSERGAPAGVPAERGTSAGVPAERTASAGFPAERDALAGFPAERGAPGGGDGSGLREGDALKPLPGESLPAGGLRVGEAKSALAAGATPSAAAVVRMLNKAEESRLNKALVQTAPPSHRRPAHRTTPAAASGPLLMDSGALTAGAGWRDGMDCGNSYGEVTRSAATLGAASVGGAGVDALVAVPEKITSLSTTMLEKAADGARPVAEATVSVRTFELFDGAVRVKVLRAPTLRTEMSTVEGGEVRYRPAVIEVSGKGVKTTRLDAAGDSMEMTFGKRQTESLRVPRWRGNTLGDLPLPTIPGMPAVGDEGEPESVAAPGNGTSVRISLGDVRQTTVDHATAAKVTAIKIGIAQGDSGYGQGGESRLELGIGVLESAAVAPEGAGGGVSDAVAGAGAGESLPITGPGLNVMLIVGAGLLAVGTAGMVLGRRRRD